LDLILTLVNKTYNKTLMARRKKKPEVLTPY